MNKLEHNIGAKEMTDFNKQIEKVECVNCQKYRILLSNKNFICSECGFDNTNFIEAIDNLRLKHSFLGFMKVYDMDDNLIN